MGFSKWISLILILRAFLALPTYSKPSLSPEELAQIPVNFIDFVKRPELFDWMVAWLVLEERYMRSENPELGFEEFDTRNLIRAELDQMGISYKYPFAETGVVCYVGTGSPPFVAIRADISMLLLCRFISITANGKAQIIYKNYLSLDFYSCGQISIVDTSFGINNTVGLDCFCFFISLAVSYSLYTRGT